MPAIVILSDVDSLSARSREEIRACASLILRTEPAVDGWIATELGRRHVGDRHDHAELGAVVQRHVDATARA